MFRGFVRLKGCAVYRAYRVCSIFGILGPTGLSRFCCDFRVYRVIAFIGLAERV